MDKFKPIHIHLLLKCVIQRPFIDPENGKQFLVELVDRINMVPVTEPQCVYVSAPGNEGLTGSINLATSHIAWHCWDETGELQLDVYSCTNFDHYVVLDTVEKYFHKIEKYHLIVLDRSNFNTILNIEEDEC